MNIGVIGTGYVGLMTGAGFGSLGHRVACADNDADKIAALQKGVVPWYEPGLAELVRETRDAGRLKFTTDVRDTVRSSSIVFVAVGTPPNDDGSADTRSVLRVAREIGAAVLEPTTVVVRSTVPVGTTQAVASVIEEQAGFPCPVLSNPEFFREGRAIEDFRQPSRVVIGADREEDAENLRRLYLDVADADRILTLDTRSAEMSKYASNAFLATKISFINEIANLCEALGADVERVREVMGLDPRIGPAHLAPGVGYGGSCLPKDTQAVAHMGAQAGTPMTLVEAVHQVNSAQVGHLVERIRACFNGDLREKRIAVWGLSFKPDTDDLRDAPALALIDLLLDEGAEVVAYDPSAQAGARALMDGLIEHAHDEYACVRGADALVLVTEWEQFRRPDWRRVRTLMNTPIVFDGRNIYDPQTLARAGLKHHGIGRPERRRDVLLSYRVRESVVTTSA